MSIDTGESALAVPPLLRSVHLEVDFSSLLEDGRERVRGAAEAPQPNDGRRLRLRLLQL